MATVPLTNIRSRQRACRRSLFCSRLSVPLQAGLCLLPGLTRKQQAVSLCEQPVRHPGACVTVQESRHSCKLPVLRCPGFLTAHHQATQGGMSRQGELTPPDARSAPAGERAAAGHREAQGAASCGERADNEGRAGDDIASARGQDWCIGSVDQPRNVGTAAAGEGHRCPDVVAVLENADPLPGPARRRRQRHLGSAGDLDPAHQGRVAWGWPFNCPL